MLSHKIGMGLTLKNPLKLILILLINASGFVKNPLNSFADLTVSFTPIVSKYLLHSY